MIEYSIAELRQTGACEYRQVGTGSFFLNRNGRRVENTRGVEYIPTKIGKIEKPEWHRMIEEAAARENQTELLGRIEKACHRMAWLKTDKDRHEYALGVLCSGAYLYWPEWSSSSSFVFRFDEEDGA